MRKILSLLALVVSAMLVATEGTKAVDESRPGSVVGTVENERGHAVAGATVVIVTRDDRGSHRLRTQSDRLGHFKFRRVPAGRHGIAARKADVGADRQRITVRSGETTRAQLVLHGRRG